MSRDFKDLLLELYAHEVEYLVVGAHALAAHGHVRATRDLELWVRPSRGNAERVLSALGAFGAPLHDLGPDDLKEPGVVFQIGVPPVRVDIVTAIDGVEFDEAWQDRVESRFSSVEVLVLSRRHLIRNKRAAGRTRDLADLERLGESD